MDETPSARFHSASRNTALQKEDLTMKKAVAALLCACMLFSMSGCAVGAGRAKLPDRLTAEPVSREMVDLVRTLRAKS